MKKSKLILLLILVLCLAAAVCWVYYETELQLGDILPNESWTDLTFYEGNPGIADREISGVELNAVLDTIRQTTLTRGSAFRGMSQPYYLLYLYNANSAPTFLYVLEDGRIAVAIASDADHYKYFEGGGELYAALCEIE